MVYALVLLVCAGFVAFFSLLELWYFGIFPLIFFFLFFSQGFWEFKVKVSQHDMVTTYGLYLVGLLTFFGIFGLLNFMGLDVTSSFFALMILSLILWYLSYVFNYQDGKQLFLHFFLLISLLLLGNSVLMNNGFLLALTQLDFSVWLWILSLCWITAMAGAWYGLGSFFEVDRNVYYYLLFAVFIGILDLIYYFAPINLMGVNLCLLFYVGVLGLLAYCKDFSPSATLEAPKLSLRRILAGEKIVKKPKKVYFSCDSFFITLSQLPKSLQFLLENGNLILLILLLVFYLSPLFNGEVFNQFYYWAGVGLFLCNAFLLKRCGYFSYLTRMAVGIVVNFSLYICLIILWDGVTQMLPWLIAWNILCSLLIFYAKIPSIKKYFQKSDLVFWLLTTLVATLLNVVLLLRLNLSGQLIFSLIFFYLGVQGFISYYAMQAIKDYDLVESKDGAGSLDELVEKELSLM